MFTPESRTKALYNHVVDSNFSFVIARNDEDAPVTFARHERIGTLEDATFTTAYQVSPDAANLARLAAEPAPFERPNISVPSAPLHLETKLPNGITVYGDHITVAALKQVVEAYAIWGENEGFVNIPEDQWMEIPLVEGWESKVPKSRVYHLGPKDREVVDETFDELHHKGRMEWATGHTPTCFPVFVVWKDVIKPDGKVIRKGRAVVDLRNLKKIVEHDCYPVPTQEDIIKLTNGCHYISVIDATKFYYQWRVKPAHRNRIAVISHRGQEIFNVCIMGNCNAVAYVQRQMDLHLKELAMFCRAYINDIVIASRTLDDHIQHLHMLFQKLTDLNISISPDKSYIGFPNVQLLGQRVDALGMSTVEEKLKAITSLSFPRSLKELETYLGMTGALRHYIAHFAQKSAPLQDRKARLLKGSPVKGAPRQRFAARTAYLDPTSDELDSFMQLQAEFARPKWLAHHDRERRLYMELDSSKERGHGAVVYHVKKEYDHAELKKPPPRAMMEPIMFFSRTLTPAERHYWPTELEVSSLIWVLRKIRHLVEAAPCDLLPVIYTDHSATISIAKQSSLTSSSTDRLNLRLVRASQYIQQFNLLIYHKPGKENVVADALSRLPAADMTPSSEPDLDVLYVTVEDESYALILSVVELSDGFKNRLKDAYLEDHRAKAILDMLRAPTDDPIKTVLPYKEEDGLLYSLRNADDWWLYIPYSVAQEIFRMVHDDQGHQGFDRAYAKMRGYAIYKGVSRLREYIKHCPECLINAPRTHKPYGSLQPILSPPIPYHTLTIDFILGLPVSKGGNDAILSQTDKFTKQIGLIAGKATWSAEDWAIALVDFWQRADWGVPVVIICDRDRKFLSALWTSIFQGLGVQMLYATAYHQQTDGQSERTNLTVGIMVRHWAATHPDKDWEQALPSFQATLNGSVNISTGVEPHVLMYGMKLRTPWNMLRSAFKQDFASRDDAKESLNWAMIRMKRIYDSHHKDVHFAVGNEVYLCLGDGYDIPANAIAAKKVRDKRAGPFKVLERVGKLAYRLDIPATWRIHPVISVAHLEPAPKGPDPYGRTATEPGAVLDERFPEDTDRYEVEVILDKRTRCYGRSKTPTTHYLVRWKGYTAAGDQWLHERNLVGAEELIKEFEASRA
ncbi:hypothetical protein VTN96DRAFT_2781 [Rasamsonia emersonii]